MPTATPDQTARHPSCRHMRRVAHSRRLIGWTIFHQDAVYRELSIDVEADAGDGIDWDGLRARNPDIAAWVSVEGTPVDFPVVSPREGDPKGFYLNHDLDRNWSFSGCPYLDRAAGRTGAMRLSTATTSTSTARCSPTCATPGGRRSSIPSVTCAGRRRPGTP